MAEVDEPMAPLAPVTADAGAAGELAASEGPAPDAAPDADLERAEGDTQSAAEAILAAQAAVLPAAGPATVGLGVDLVSIERMSRVLTRTPAFKQRVFTEGERDYCERTANPAAHYATRFAAKEAVLKALGTGFSAGIVPDEVEVCRNAKGRPYVKLHGCAREAAARLGVRELPLSLSYTHTDAVACAMAITESSDRASAERIDPKEELAKQFKETRSLLDDLPARKSGGTSPAPSSGHGPKPAPSAGSQPTHSPDSLSADLGDEARA